ncbi:hypothetical protein ANCCAN_02350 [Ancylostoma caninum]|uniref:Uncharacterized protein n=1 Tax=Ancylostoma caninum TaxID=29170 RepID=A0A368H8K0_ANCCA|nr:hypothetical protein ANCCAN_02350 [Ancylostoma caninum]
MPRPCHPLCAEKRDFMEVNPPRSEKDFYAAYDPMVGIGTAIVLMMFFFVVTVKSCVRYAIRKWRMHQFYKRTPPGDAAADDEQPIAETA